MNIWYHWIALSMLLACAPIHETRLSTVVDSAPTHTSFEKIGINCDEQQYPHLLCIRFDPEQLQNYQPGHALLNAHLANLAYASKEQIHATLTNLGFESIATRSMGDIQFVLARWGEGDVFVSFRGTIPKLSNIIVDAAAMFQPVCWWDEKEKCSSNVGSAHAGFVEGLKEMRHALVDLLRRFPQGTRVHLSGHSLGGALAQLTAIYLGLAPTPFLVQSVHSFGSPRVFSGGLAVYAASLRIPFYRVVQAHDFVSGIPLAARGFRHFGHVVIYHKDGRREEDPSETLFEGLMRNIAKISLPSHFNKVYLSATENDLRSSR